VSPNLIRYLCNKNPQLKTITLKQQFIAELALVTRNIYMSTSEGSKEKLESPIIFWASIGVCIGCSLGVTMKLDSVALILSGFAGLAIGLGVGYGTKKSQDKSDEQN
jgi:hypothetical protein